MPDTPELGRILIADDDELFLCTTKTVLEQEGYSCSCTTDVSTIAELAKKEPYDLLIASISMPDGARLEWIPALRKAAHLPIILTTGLPCLESAMRAIHFQAAAYLVKPFEVQLLLSEVARVITHGRAVGIMQKIYKRWRERAEELREVIEYKDPVVWTSSPSVELLLTTVLDDLSHSFSILRELRTLLGQQKEKTLDLPSRVRVEVPVQLYHAMSLTWGSLWKHEEQRDPSPGLRQEGESRQFSYQQKPNLSQETPLCSIPEKTQPGQIRTQLQQLSRRERDVLRLLLTNQKPKTIANTLFISAHTVRNHLRSIFEKLSVHSQTELLMRLGHYSTYAEL